MSSRIIKLIGVAVLAAPFVMFFGPHSANAYDCRQPYGGHQGGNASDATCNDVGTHLRIQNGKPYQVRGDNQADSEFAAAACNGATIGDTVVVQGAETADTAVSVVQVGAGAVYGTADHVGRNVGYLAAGVDNITVNCVDDNFPFTH
jgi:hypothetical protein